MKMNIDIDLEMLVNMLEADTDIFGELGNIGGMDPATDYRYSDLEGVDFTGTDLTGYDFTGADLRNCIGLPSLDDAKKMGLILTDADLV